MPIGGAAVQIGSRFVTPGMVGRLAGMAVRFLGQAGVRAAPGAAVGLGASAVAGQIFNGNDNGATALAMNQVTPGQVLAPHMVVRTWIANGVPFAQLADGRVAVQRKNGTIRIFRRPKPIVLGRNPRVRDLVRADKKIEQLVKVTARRSPSARRARRPQPRGGKGDGVSIVRTS